MNDNPSFKAFTEPGRVLEPTRVLVGSTGNFGAPKAVAEDMPESLLSIDPGPAEAVEVPADFAASESKPRP